MVLFINAVSSQCPPQEAYSPCLCDLSFYDDGAILLNCNRQYIGDQKMSEILDYFLSDLGLNYSLRSLDLQYNFLTKIPDQITFLPQLQEIDLYANDIQEITTGSLTLNSAETIVLMFGPKIKTIEPGAFATGIVSFILIFDK